MQVVLPHSSASSQSPTSPHAIALAVRAIAAIDVAEIALERRASNARNRVGIRRVLAGFWAPNFGILTRRRPTGGRRRNVPPPARHCRRQGRVMVSFRVETSRGACSPHLFASRRSSTSSEPAASLHVVVCTPSRAAASRSAHKRRALNASQSRSNSTRSRGVWLAELAGKNRQRPTGGGRREVSPAALRCRCLGA